MRGSVIRRGDVYYVKIELDPDPGTGQRRTKWHSGYRTKREAERARVDLLSKVDRGVYVEPSAETVAEFLDHWLVSIRPTLKATTWNGYRSKVRNHVVPYIGGMRLNRIDGGTLNELYARLLEAGRRKPSRTGKGYSPEVVARAQALRAEGLSLQATADRLQVEFNEASHITKDTLASLLRRQAAYRADPTIVDDDAGAAAHVPRLHRGVGRSEPRAVGPARHHRHAPRRDARRPLAGRRPRRRPAPRRADGPVDQREDLGQRTEDGPRATAYRSRPINRRRAP